MLGVMTIFRPEGPPEVRPLTATPELEELQKLVGGYLEAVPMWKRFRGKPCAAFCDEEGKLKEYPVNVAASAEWKRVAPLVGDVLVGTVVVLTGDSEFMDSL